MLTSQSEAETVAFGRRLAGVLVAGDVLSLDGELGTGKTRLVQGLAEGLGGSRDWVTSPTFTLLQEYPTQPPLTHADAYRVHDSDEFLALGVSELWEEGIVVIEWGSKVRDALPSRTIDIVGAIQPDDTRLFSLTISNTIDRSRHTAIAGIFAAGK